MSVNLVLLKSGEELITDVKEIKSGNEIVGYFFDDPLRLNFSPEQEPEVLQESETSLKYNSKISITFFPWVPFAAQRKQIPCSLSTPFSSLKTTGSSGEYIFTIRGS